MPGANHVGDDSPAPAREFELDGCVTGDGTSAADIPEEAYLQHFGQRPRATVGFSVFESGEGDGRSVADIPEDELMRGFGDQ